MYQIVVQALDRRLHGNVFCSHHLCLDGFFLDVGKNLKQSRAVTNNSVVITKMLNYIICAL